MKKNKNLYYWLGGLAVVIVLAAVVVFSQGEWFQGRLRLSSTKTSMTTSSTIVNAPQVQPIIQPPTAWASTVSYPFASDNMHVMGFVIKAGSSALNFVPYSASGGGNLTFHKTLYGTYSSNLKLSNCTLSYGSNTGIPASYVLGNDVKFNLPAFIIPANTSVAFTLSCDISDYQSGDSFGLMLGRIDYNNSPNASGIIWTPDGVESPKITVP